MDVKEPRPPVFRELTPGGRREIRFAHQAAERWRVCAENLGQEACGLAFDHGRVVEEARALRREAHLLVGACVAYANMNDVEIRDAVDAVARELEK